MALHNHWNAFLLIKRTLVVDLLSKIIYTADYIFFENALQKLFLFALFLQKMCV